MLDEYRGHHTEMMAALHDAAERVTQDAPEAVAVMSARWTGPGAFLVDAARRHRTLTDDTDFGVEVRYDCTGHPALARALVTAGERARCRVATAAHGVDGGAAVPLHFLVPSRKLPVVPLSIATRSAEECRAWGSAIRRTLQAWPERVLFVVGGVLSFNQHAWSLRRDVPESAEFDRRALSALERGAWEGLDAEDGRTLERVQPEAGLRHLDVLRGFLGDGMKAIVRCYESSPGVGAALLEFETPSVPAAQGVA